MLAKELISILEENNPDYSRQSLLQEINYVQKIVFGAANMYTVATDPSTGRDPKIVPDQTEYVISDAFRIDRIYKENYSIPLNVRIVDDTIYFAPEMVGQEYSVRYHKRINELTSESMELTIPDEYVHYLEDGIEERLSSKEHGSKDGWRYWLKREMPTLRRKLNNNYRWGMPDGTKKISTNNRTVRRTSYCS